MPPEQLWQFISSYQLARAPGEQFLYSNLGSALLARAMVRRSNATEDQLYARIITGPLGMHDTAIELTPGQRARLAQGFQPDGSRRRSSDRVFRRWRRRGCALDADDMMRYLDFELGRMDVPLRSLLPALHQPRHAAESERQRRPRLGRCMMARTAKVDLQGWRSAGLCIVHGFYAIEWDRHGGPVKPDRLSGHENRRADHRQPERTWHDSAGPAAIGRRELIGCAGRHRNHLADHAISVAAPAPSASAADSSPKDDPHRSSPWRWSPARRRPGRRDRCPWLLPQPARARRC